MHKKCQVCRGSGDSHLMLLCDNCDRGFHTYCTSPKLNSVPPGDWFCPRCSAKASFELETSPASDAPVHRKSVNPLAQEVCGESVGTVAANPSKLQKPLSLPADGPLSEQNWRSVDTPSEPLSFDPPAEVNLSVSDVDTLNEDQLQALEEFYYTNLPAEEAKKTGRWSQVASLFLTLTPMLLFFRLTWYREKNGILSNAFEDGIEETTGDYSR